MKTYDYVIVGGGSAGCVLANRLSADPGIRVCLLEAGGNNRSALISAPGAFGYFMFSKKFNWAYSNKTDGSLRKGQPIFLPRGKGLGGSSAINGMICIRGHRADYDEWAALGNKGWSYEEVLPYFKRSEDNSRGADRYHGQGGPLLVSDCELHFPISKVFLEAARQVGLPLTDDFNGDQQEGAGAYQFTIRSGKRAGVAATYLRPVLHRTNLTVITGAHVMRVEFSDNKAVGVTYEVGGERCTVHASREVVLSAGAYNSPQILMLSGVGDPAELSRHGIEVRHALPGVGRNLLDHVDGCVLTRSRNHGGLALTLRGGLRMAWNIVRYAFTGQGILRASPCEVGAFLRTSPEQAVPDVQFHAVPLLYDDCGRDFSLLTKTGYSLHVCVLRPKSVGRVGLASADPRTPPAIDHRLLEHPDDLRTLLAGVRLARQWLAAPAFASYRECEIAPGADLQGDEELAKAVRERIGTAYHPVGTCKMGSDDMAVVDSELRVHGMRGLRVVDASVMPTLVAGNTNAPTIMVAEKASDMILAARASERTSSVSISPDVKLPVKHAEHVAGKRLEHSLSSS
jgi:choline dehydrogenase